MKRLVPGVMVVLLAVGCGRAEQPGIEGSWRGVVDLAGGPLRFALEIDGEPEGRGGRLCNAGSCQRLSAVAVTADSVMLEIGDYAATIRAARRGDSLLGSYQNVGNRGPRVIPFRAARGRWPVEPAGTALTGRWDATFNTDGRLSPRVLEFSDDTTGFTGTIISNTGDYGLFWGRAAADSFSLGHFDGSFVYMLTGRLDGDTLRGLFHAGATSQTPWTAIRSTGRPHLAEPTTLTRADSTQRFRFAFPDLAGRVVTQDDPRFQGKVLVVDIFGTWCPTCHDAAPALTALYREYRERGLEMVGLAYEVSGDPAVDGPLVERYREKFGITFPLLLAGVNQNDLTAATLPQLDGFTAYPTTLFLDRRGRIRHIHAGFYGPATGARHTQLLADYRATIERLLAEPAR